LPYRSSQLTTRIRKQEQPTTFPDTEAITSELDHAPVGRIENRTSCQPHARTERKLETLSCNQAMSKPDTDSARGRQPYPLAFLVRVSVLGEDEVILEGEAQINRTEFGLTFNPLGMA
jgi:hypothetical protein